MMKHLLLMVVGAPLILLGAPTLPLLCGLPKYFMRRSLLLRKTPRLLGHFLSNPVFCWLAGTAAVIAWHVPALFQLGLSSQTWHIVEDASFLIAGLLFWRPIVRTGPRDAKGPQWSMPVYLFLATLPCDILSAFLTFCGRVVYPSYVSTARIFSLSPLQDQECAGALMWVCVTFAYLIPAVVITMQILSPGGAHEEVQSALYSSRSAVADYWALTKPEVNFLIAIATFSGFYLGLPASVPDFPWLQLMNTLLGTLLVASGTGTLNQYVERRFDAQMRRTARRPLAAGRLKPAVVLWFGIALASVG